MDLIKNCDLSSKDLMKLESINEYKKYKCSKITSCNGFTLLMHLVKLTHKYPSLCTNIKEYCEKYPEEVNKVNKNGWTALMIATRNIGYKSNISVVKILLENGADPYMKTHGGNTALCMSLININKDTCQVINLLLQFGEFLKISEFSIPHLVGATIYSDSMYELSTLKLLLEYDNNIKIWNLTGTNTVNDIKLLNIKN